MAPAVIPSVMKEEEPEQAVMQSKQFIFFSQLYFLFYFFFYKNKQFKKQKHIFSWLYKLQNSMTLVTLAFTLLLSLKANSLDTPCL